MQGTAERSTHRKAVTITDELEPAVVFTFFIYIFTPAVVFTFLYKFLRRHTLRLTIIYVLKAISSVCLIGVTFYTPFVWGLLINIALINPVMIPFTFRISCIVP